MLDAHVIKTRRRFTVDAEVQVAAGETCALFGVSGSGKSTILSCIAGTEEPSGGHVRLDGRTLFPPPMTLRERRTGYLTQEAQLFPHLRVDQNVCYGLRDGRAEADAPWVAELRERLQLGRIWREPVPAISGGQARRVALARMLARKPRLVLLDEPFSGLDRQFVRELLGTIADWHQRFRFIMVVVDHQADVLERLCSRVLALEDGRVVQDTTWSDLRARPATAALRELLSPL